MEFIVSARKYRPITFQSVVGQSHITHTLKNAIKSQQLAHAYLFCGSRGVGKTTCARIFAKTINCQNLTAEFEACDQCESCRSFRENRSYNIHGLDAASNNSVDDIRLLIDKVRVPPQIGKYSVYIIDEVHMLSSQAFNAFLKTLEEPPGHGLFILVSSRPHALPITIRSRCHALRFTTPARTQVEAAVILKRELPPADAHFLAVLADGLDVDDVAGVITSDTRLVVLTHASNVVGTLLPVAEVAAIAHRAGALLLVDAAQTAGVIPIDMTAMGIDLLAKSTPTSRIVYQLSQHSSGRRSFLCSGPSGSSCHSRSPLSRSP